MHFTRMSTYARRRIPIIVRGEGAYIYDDHGKRYLDGLSGLFVVPGRARPHRSWPRPPPSRPRSSPLPAVVLRASRGDRARRAAARLAPGDLNRVFFTTGGGEAVETAWKLAKQYFKADRQAGQAQGDLPRDRLPRHPAGRPVHHRAARRSRTPFEPLRPGGVRVPNTNFYRAPDRSRDDQEEFGHWAANQIERADPVRGPRHGRRRLPRAGAELRRLLPAAAGLLPAGPRDLRPVRRAAGLRRGDLRVRPARLLCSACDRYGYQPDMITCAKGMTSGYSPLGAHDRVRPLIEPFSEGDELVPARLHVRRASGLLAPWRWPTWTSSSRRT